MYRLSKTFTLFALLVLFLVSTSPLNAAGKKGSISLEQASEMARLQSKGKVLSAKTTNFKGGKTHRIQVLTPSGRVKIFKIPSNKGNSRNPQKHVPRYSNDRANSRSNHSSHQHRTTNSTSRNHSNRSSGDHKQK
ncbi:MAG: hypothetical protein L3J83_09090 [Proteobacteria bacterium]|nr:hypothetical protein [Pseudomonadota bacterium]